MLDIILGYLQQFTHLHKYYHAGIGEIIDISISEILPLWMALSPEKGGMGYKSENISYILSISACIGILSQPLYILMERYILRINIFIISLVMSAITMIIIPYISIIQQNQFVVLCIVNIVRYIFVCCIFNIVYTTISSSASISSFTSNDTSTNATNIGHINGIAQSSGSVCKVLCPVFIDPLFSTFSQNNDSYFNYHFVFNMLSLITFGPYIITFYIDRTKVNQLNCSEKQSSSV